MNDRCHDCGVVPGQHHVPGCDMETCPFCGLQAIGCEHGRRGWADAESIVWDGESVLHRAAVHFGFWCVLVVGRGWCPRPVGTPGASPDLNRVLIECEWSRMAKMWVKRPGYRRGDRS